MEIIDCIGSPRTRGEVHGEALRKRIATALENWEAATMAGLGPRAPADFDGYCDDFLSGTALLHRAEAVTPDLMAELRGIAIGAGQSFARIAVYNLMDEQWWYDAAPKAPPPGCSLIAQRVPGGHVLAQNMDLPAHMEGSQVALRLGGPDMPETVMLSAAGMIGLTGVNFAGLAIGVNTLLMLEHAPDGLPVAFAVRHALGARNRATAQRRLAEVGHASGQHYAIATREGITSLECSARTCLALPIPDNGRLLHTNHPLISSDIDTTALARLGSSGFTKSSAIRLSWLAAQEDALTTAEEVQTLFDDPEAPIRMRAKTHGGSSTFATVLYSMTDCIGVRMRQDIADTARWQEFNFREGAGE
ncbi:C45 family autoproteolytic acyltransferase/hydrolase [Sulfitobacter sp. 1A15333]|uniref:C45 family autoproteolytic acyltransferase/hydolase n=1 Tax=Sulfitobacter sp. 1A15333 TaxID=3368570 RepID=UPI003744DB55